MKYATLFLLSLLFAFGISPIWAQRFSAGVGIGLIASQMDGDGFSGYDKFGKRIGIRGLAYISETIDFVIEMNWEEKGAKFEPIEGAVDRKKTRTIHLAYAEIPILLRFFRKRRGGLFGEIGASISYLVKNRFQASGEGSLAKFSEIAGEFNRSEWNAVIGGGYQLDPHFGVLFRTTIGFQHLYQDLEVLRHYQSLPSGHRDRQGEPIYQLRNYLVSFGVYFII